MEPILYLGDGRVDGAAAYLAGVMAHFGLDYVHIPSSEALPDDVMDGNWSTAVFSDYPSSNMNSRQMMELAGLVEGGRGLLMFGGWGSYHGLDGHYSGTPLENLLPVYIDGEDDRVNWPGPCLVTRSDEHVLVDGLPFDSDAPGIGGFNRVRASKEGRVLLEARRYQALIEPGRSRHGFQPAGDPDPLLVVGQYGTGRVGCWTTDVAPHWVGGFVDWGSNRVVSRGSAPAIEVEVGDLYAEFFRRLLLWSAGVPGF